MTCGEEVSVVASVIVDELVRHPERELSSFIKERFGKVCPPKGTWSELVSATHKLGHFGGDAVYQKLWAAGNYWPGMRKMCFDAVARCDACIKFNVHRSGFLPMRSVAAKFPFEHIAIDLAQLPPSRSGMIFVFVLVDLATRFVVLDALRDKTARSVARALWRVICLFGVPKVIQSDNGPEFVNDVIHALCELMGVNKRTVAQYNPQANGAAERHVRTFKMCLRKHLGGNLAFWDLYLPAVNFAINSKRAAVNGSAPFSLLFARPVNMFMDFAGVGSDLMSEGELVERNKKVMDLIYPENLAVTEKSQKKSAVRTDRKRKIVKKDPFPKGSQVMLADPGRGANDPAFVGPYTVLRRDRNGCYRLIDQAGHELDRKVPVQHLKGVPPGALSDAPAFRVHAVMEHRGAEGQREYRVRWWGYGPEHDTWEPEACFDDQRVLTEYWNSVRADDAAGDA